MEGHKDKDRHWTYSVITIPGPSTSRWNGSESRLPEDWYGGGGKAASAEQPRLKAWPFANIAMLISRAIRSTSSLTPPPAGAAVAAPPSDGRHYERWREFRG
jgi:hypothetical protein